MTDTLTQEQIAQGWIAYTDNGEPPFKKEVNGPPFQLGWVHDGELCTTAVITESLPDEIDWSNVAAYRVWVPRVSSPPISEDLMLEWDEDGTLLINNRRTGVTVDREALQFAVDFIRRNQTQKEDAISPLTNEPLGVTKPKCGVAGEISLPAMGLDYFYNPSDWEWTQNADDDSCIADWLSESMVDVMEIQTLIEGPLLFAANIPTKWDEDGEVTNSEVTYFDTEEDAKSALSAAIGERG